MRVLIVEDEPLSYAQLQQVLEAAPFEIEIVGHLETKGEVVEFLRNRPALDVILSDEAMQIYTETNKVISPSKNVEVKCIDALKPLNDRVDEGVYVLASNASMKMEQWGNVCLVVRKLLNGASVDECMAEIDRLQEEAMHP